MLLNVLRQSWLAISSALLIAGVAITPAHAQLAQTLQFQATDLRALGFVGTRDVNARGDVLGTDSSGRSLLFSQGRVRVLDVGDSFNSYLNDAGQVAGSRYNASSGQWESKLYSNGVVSSLNVPATARIAGFNNSGQMLAADQSNGIGYFGTNNNLTEFDFYWTRQGFSAVMNNTGLIATLTGGNVVAFRVTGTGAVQQLLNRQVQSSIDSSSVQFQYSFDFSGLNDRDQFILTEHLALSCSNTWAAGDWDGTCERNSNFQSSYYRSYSLQDLFGLTEISYSRGASLGGVYISSPYEPDYGFGVGGLNNQGDYVSGYAAFGINGRLSDGSWISPGELTSRFGIELADWGQQLQIGDNRHLLVAGQTYDTGESVLLLLTPVPEPSAYLMLMAGLVGLAAARRRSR